MGWSPAATGVRQNPALGSQRTAPGEPAVRLHRRWLGRWLRRWLRGGRVGRPCRGLGQHGARLPPAIPSAQAGRGPQAGPGEEQFRETLSQAWSPRRKARGENRPAAGPSKGPGKKSACEQPGAAWTSPAGQVDLVGRVPPDALSHRLDGLFGSSSGRRAHGPRLAAFDGDAGRCAV